jgi:DNA polymerase-3 subunit gamma/tau
VSLALYRRYRPDSFEEVVGQDHVTLPLQQALRNGRVNHAYLFSGPRGCGKTTSARILARCLNCEEGPTPTPCGKCQSCVDLANGGGGSIDVIEIDAASHGGVDDARDLRERAFFAPAASRFKIYIIDEAHMVTSAGFNALLKVVEEPPPHLKFIFATTEPEKVIGTIRSRTHHYPFRLVPPGVLRDHLADITGREDIKVEPEVLPLVVRAGAGSVRDAMSVLDQLLAGSDENGVSYAMATSLLGYTDAALLDELIDAFGARDGAGVFRLVDQVVESGHDPRRFLADLLERFRDLVILNAVADADSARGLIDVPDDQFGRMAAQARTFGPAELSRAADLVNTGLTEMRGATAPRLLLELVCARVMLPGSDDTERGLAARVDRIERRAAVGPIGIAPAGPGSDADGGPALPPVRQQVPAQGISGSGSSGPGGSGSVAAGLGTPPWQQGAAAAEVGSPPQHAVAGPPDESQNAGGPAGLGTPPWQTGSAGPNPGATAGTSPGASPGADGQNTGAGLGTPPWQQNSGSGPSGSSGAGPARSGGPNADEPAQDQNPGSSPAQSPQTPAAPPAQTTATPTGRPPAGSGTTAGSAEVRRMWPDLVEEVKRRDGRVSWMLLSQNAQVVGVDSGRLQVAFINAGARDRFVSRGTADTLRQAATDLFGVNWQIDALVDPSQTPGIQVAPGVSLAPAAPSPSSPSPTQYGAADSGAASAPSPQSEAPDWASQSGPPSTSAQSTGPTPSNATSARSATPTSTSTAPSRAESRPEPPRSAPSAPTVAPEDDVASDDDEDAADNGSTAHDLVVRELGGQLLDKPDA